MFGGWLGGWNVFEEVKEGSNKKRRMGNEHLNVACFARLENRNLTCRQGGKEGAKAIVIVHGGDAFLKRAEYI